jgi:hypothetical protein
MSEVLPEAVAIAASAAKAYPWGMSGLKHKLRRITAGEKG